MFARGNRGLALGVAAFVLAAALRMAGPVQDQVFPDALTSLASVYVYVGIIVAWMASAHRRLLPSRMRAFALASAGCMLAWMLVRSLKYRLMDVDYLVSELLWYLYYPLQFGMLLFLLLACIEVARRGKPPLHAVQATLGLACVALSLLVLSNDVHQLAFEFGVRYPADPNDYRRGPVYWACVVMLVGMAVGSLVVLERAQGVRTLARRDAVPIAIALAAVVYLAVLQMLLVPSGAYTPFTFPEVVCFSTLLAWEWLIRVRLIPSNDRYDELFAAMAMPACIVDGRVVPVLESGVPLQASAEQLSEALAAPVMLDENTRLQAHPITAGAVCWAVDLSAINRANAALREAGEQLAGENDLLAAENELAVQAARAKAREAGYERALEAVRPHLQEIAQRAARLDPRVPDFKRDLAFLAVEGAYVKRAMNLRLLAADAAEGKEPGATELALSIQEVLAACKRAGVSCAFSSDVALSREAGESASGALAAPDAIQAFDVFWDAVAAALPTARQLCVRLAADGMLEVRAS